MSLYLQRKDNETWFQCAMRYAKKYGMENEIKEWYNHYIEKGRPENEAALLACEEWDILDFRSE